MSEENRKKEETMEEPTREMEKETGAETDLPETEPAAEQEEAKKATVTPVSYTHLRSPRDKRQSRMPSSA